MTTRERILQAVDDEDWQQFRRSLKGISTQDKLRKLRRYFIDQHDSFGGDAFYFEEHMEKTAHNCDFCIRVDNYIKALCRGGQLYPGESIETALKNGWKLRVKR